MSDHTQNLDPLNVDEGSIQDCPGDDFCIVDGVYLEGDLAIGQLNKATDDGQHAVLAICGDMWTAISQELYDHLAQWALGHGEQNANERE